MGSPVTEQRVHDPFDTGKLPAPENLKALPAVRLSDERPFKGARHETQQDITLKTIILPTSRAS
jgi:hypothetical protein